MARVLILEDDPACLETYDLLCRANGLSTVAARDVDCAAALVTRGGIDVIIADLRLGESSALEFLRRMTGPVTLVPVVVVTGFGTIASAVEAMSLGAVNYFEKPVEEEVLIGALVDAVSRRRHSVASARAGRALSDNAGRLEVGLSAQTVEVSRAERRDNPLVPAPLDSGPSTPAANAWARLVTGMIELPDDPKTLQEWAEFAGAAKGTLANRCRAARVSPKASLDFGRMLRAVVQARRFGCSPEDLLDCDPRTLKRLVAASGLVENLTSAPELEGFIERQWFITNSLVLRALRRAFGRSPEARRGASRQH